MISAIQNAIWRAGAYQTVVLVYIHTQLCTQVKTITRSRYNFVFLFNLIYSERHEANIEVGTRVNKRILGTISRRLATLVNGGLSYL
jgi:hypothetical protein